MVKYLTWHSHQQDDSQENASREWTWLSLGAQVGEGMRAGGGYHVFLPVWAHVHLRGRFHLTNSTQMSMSKNRSGPAAFSALSACYCGFAWLGSVTDSDVHICPWTKGQLHQCPMSSPNEQSPRTSCTCWPTCTSDCQTPMRKKTFCRVCSGERYGRGAAK